MGNLLILLILVQITACVKTLDMEPDPELKPEPVPLPFDYSGDAYFVAPWGDDSNPGTQDDQFADICLYDRGLTPFVWMEKCCRCTTYRAELRCCMSLCDMVADAALPCIGRLF